jgi:hypothetical protein
MFWLYKLFYVKYVFMNHACPAAAAAAPLDTRPQCLHKTQRAEAPPATLRPAAAPYGCGRGRTAASRYEVQRAGLCAPLAPTLSRVNIT